MKKRLTKAYQSKTLAQENHDPFSNTLSEIVFLRTYARYLDPEHRRETWGETVDRYMQFMREHLGDNLSAALFSQIHQMILQQEIMPSMRLMQFAGPVVKKNNAYAYNCAYIAPASLQDFGEVMYISMCGCGVGFSVESHNIQKLPIIKKQSTNKLKKHIIADSKEGWCKAFTIGLKTWFAGNDIEFDFSKLRAFGARLKTTGGRSSGSDPLRSLLAFTRNIILNNQGRRLSNIDVYDILCKTGEVVVSGGVRRSAMISLSDLDDQAMREAKAGQFYYSHPQRSFSNNSAVYETKPSDAVLLEEWQALIDSGTGERGIYNRGSVPDTSPKRRLTYFKFKRLIENNRITGMIGCNPCGEIILQSKQFCNLTEVVARPDDTFASLSKKIRIASLIGTYQASLTHFKFLSEHWKKHCEDEALLGVSITGIWDCKYLRNSTILNKLKKIARDTNKKYAEKFSINPATAVTCIKPSGTVSQITNTASGIHPRYAPYYIRRVRIASTDALSQLLIDQGVPYHPEVGYSADDTPCYVFDFPIASPKGSVVRNQLSALDQLENWKLFKLHYTEHNPSVTIYVAEDEWIAVLNWLKENWKIIGGLSFLPKHKHTYQLAPYQEISKAEYMKLATLYTRLDLSKLALYEQLPDSFSTQYDEHSC